jgi:ankyrin repeat protein
MDPADAAAKRRQSELVATFLESACWDHHVHGKADHRMYDCAASRLLTQHPELARDSLYTAVVCGDIQEVERILTRRPEAACEPGGSRGWTPLLYLCYTRFTHQPTINNAVAIARLLLDRGADPNDFYMAGDARYSALVGVAGEGEQDSPRQPQAQELFQLLLERGAEPFDIQVLYNTHFSGDVLWWLELIYAHTIKTSRGAAWKDPNWSMLDMWGYGPGAYFLLKVAVQKKDMMLAEWVLSHGASPNATSSHPMFKPRRTLYEDAVLDGLTDVAALLVRHGASATVPVLDEQESFIDACFTLDRDRVRADLERHPEYLEMPAAMFAAAQKDRVDVITFLLDLGVPIEVHDEHNTRSLHHAAGDNALRVARLLIERGAEIDPIETNYGGTPIGWAGHGDKLEMIELLSGFCRNVWTLSFRGYIDRLREVLNEEPDLAKLVNDQGITLLWWLPDDEAKAIEIVELLLAHGADPSIRSKGGKTAADWALRRGMLEVARRLGWAETAESALLPPRGIEQYESLAQDLLFAFESGQPAAIAHLQAHYGEPVLWNDLRASVRRRMDELPKSERPPGYFALPHARLLTAREAGFENWAALEEALRMREAG